MTDTPQTPNSGMTFGMNTINRGIDAGKNISGSGWLIFFFALMIYGLDILYFKFDGVNLVSVYRTLGIAGIGNLILKGVLYNAVFWIILAVFFFIKKPENKEEFISMALLIAAIVFISTLVGITNSLSLSNLGSLVHMLFIIFGIRNGILTDKYDKITSNYYTIFVLFIDFFAFNIISSIFPATVTNLNRVIVPIFPLTTLFFMESSTARSWLLFFISVFYILIVTQTYMATSNFQQTLNQNKVQGAQQQALSAWDKFKALIGGFKQSWNESNRMIAGDYYTGQVEQNQQKPLGVFLEDMKGDTLFLAGEKIEVWSKLKVQSLQNDNTPEQDIISVSVVCSLKNGSNNINGTIYPRKEFKVASYEEEFLTCTFNSLNLTPGYYPVTFNATFNFDTQSYLKTYYMDKERKRTMMANQVDILREYGISDTNPIAVYTNGPVKIGMETTTPLPIGVPSIENEFSSYIGITIDKNWGEGNLKGINKLWVELPEGTDFGDGCTDFEINPDNWNTSTGNIAQNTGSKYRLKENKTSIDNKKGFTLPKSYKCSLKLKSRNTLLGQTPVAIRYFKTLIAYDYTISRTTNINIRSQSTT